MVEKLDCGIIWIKIDQSILEFNEDAFICYIYIREPKSQVLRHEEIDYFETLEQYIEKFKNLGKIFVTGDMNSRCGECTAIDYLTFDTYLDVGLNDYINIDIPPRVSRDSILDNNGRRLLNLCKSSGLLIGNGRLGADQYIGDFTCVTNQGRSVVDYFLLPYYDFKYISHFIICDPDEFSDHCALLFHMNLVNNDNYLCSSTETNETSEPIRRLIWSCDRQEAFQNCLLQDLYKYNDLISSLESDSLSIDDVINQFSSSLFNDAYQYFGKSFSVENSAHLQSKRKSNSNPWFDNTCKVAKQNFNRAKHNYSRCKSDANRINLTHRRSKLNKAKRRAKAIHKFEEGERIKKLATSNTKQFWKEIKKITKRKSKSAENLSVNDLFTHFSNVFETQETNATRTHFDTNIQNEILDCPFSIEELKSVISSLKSDKSPGLDGLSTEIFKCSFHILEPVLIKLFNIIFFSGKYPDQWSEGVITPIHKKDSLEDPNNYRGIMLINTLSKIYSHLLNNRLLKWAAQFNKISDCQFGFQPKKSTIDCIFIFHAIISKILNRGEKLYCCFVDYQKAFDLVNRGFLWQKLIHNGCSNIMLNALQSMYKNVKACVRYKNRCSNFLEINSGVKQGDPLSPVLFVLFINDIIESISNGNADALPINDINLFMLLYADDAVLFSTSAEKLQIMVNKLNDYSSIRNLKVNTNKTKIMIFEKGRKTNVNIYYNGILLEIVDNFKYLGTMFYKNGCWNRTQKTLAEYGSFAMHNLNRLFQNITLSDNEKFKLFDCLVGPVLSYACEIWGFNGAPDVERIHTRFCRNLLGVKKSTNLAALYCELGRKPLLAFRKIRILKYWSKIIHTENDLMSRIYTMLLNDTNNGNTYNGTNWASQVKTLLDNLGFSYVWNNQENLENIPYAEIKQRIIDNVNQDLLMSIKTSTKLQSYCIFLRKYRS